MVRTIWGEEIKPVRVQTVRAFGNGSDLISSVRAVCAQLIINCSMNETNAPIIFLYNILTAKAVNTGITRAKNRF